MADMSEARAAVMALLFFKKAVPATSSGNAELAGYAGESVHFEAEGLAPRLFEVFSTDDFSAGTLTVTLQERRGGGGAALVLTTRSSGRRRG
jgi:hypothetical protein